MYQKLISRKWYGTYSHSNNTNLLICTICGKQFSPHLRQSAPSAGHPHLICANLRHLRETILSSSAPICAICGKQFSLHLRLSTPSAGKNQPSSAPICAICGKNQPSSAPIYTICGKKSTLLCAYLHHLREKISPHLRQSAPSAGHTLFICELPIYFYPQPLPLFICVLEH
jgi:DNA-directed RNA polymerase subunit RPC12/RpoP